VRLAREVSLLRAHGHPRAHCYTPWQIQQEAALTREHLTASQAHLAALVSGAIGACLDKKAAQTFSALIDSHLDPDS